MMTSRRIATRSRAALFEGERLLSNAAIPSLIDAAPLPGPMHLRAGAEPGQFLVPAERRWCSWNGLFGGALLGSAIEALEQVAGKPLLTMSALFLQGFKENEVVELRAQLRGGGKAVALATATGLHGGEAAVAVQGTLGAFPQGARSIGVFQPRRKPEDCPRRESMAYVEGGVTDTVEVRYADHDVARGAQRAQLWIRCVGVEGALSAPILAVIADHPPSALAVVNGPGWYGITLDSSLRVAAQLDRHAAGEWVLLDVQFDAFTDQMAHATVHMWSRGGEFLGVAAQTLRVRKAEPASQA
jgi:acyl-CoA thioesterase